MSPRRYYVGRYLSDGRVAPSVAHEVTPERLAAAVQADLGAPLCQSCEAADVYERSPESCPACAKNRVEAALAVLAGTEEP